MIKTLLLSAALSFAVDCAGAQLAAAAPAADVKTSTAAPATPSSVYTAERLRDPFTLAGGGGAAGAGKSFTAEDFNIHNLSLRGVMKDSGMDYALFADNSFGVSFILRRGKLYDDKNKPVKGVTGAMNVKLKTARLITADGDVQLFRLGEEDDEEE